MLKPLLTAAAAVAIATTTFTAVAAPGNGSGDDWPSQRMLGQGRPFDRDELPPGLRQRYDALNARAKRNAEAWLQRFAFPENDGETLHFDAEGAALYVDPFDPEQAPEESPEDIEAALTAEPAAEIALGAADEAFSLHSRPGAPNVVYLDFDGQTISGTAWNSVVGRSSIPARPFDLDGSPSTFGSTERAAIAEIWHRVAEDYAAFDIDVTTEEPASFGRDTGRVLITSKRDANGAAMPYDTAGGVAYIGVWGYSNYASSYSPALVYYDNLLKETTYIAEACAHEFGHNIGLSHDGTSSVTYYAGHGSGYTSWAPIMGNSYYNNVTQWSRGEYSGANNTQDDVAIIAGKLGLAGDDHGDTLNAATPLAVDVNGEILVSNPQTDPHNLDWQNKGVIDSRDDVDMFVVHAEAGAIEFSVWPAWDAFYRTYKRGANLDVRAVLRDRKGVALASSDPSADTSASIATDVGPGIYYLEVSGVGSANYTDYASAGQYFITGSIQRPSLPITMNMSPDASFDVVCADAVCSFSDTSTDPDGVIVARSWRFGDGATSTAQNPSHRFASEGAYTVTLRVTDDFGDQANASQTLSTSLPNVAPTAAFSDACSDLSCSFTDESADSDGEIVAWAWRFGDGTTSTAANPGHAYADYGTYTVSLTVTDDAGASATLTGSVELSPPRTRGNSGKDKQSTSKPGRGNNTAKAVR